MKLGAEGARELVSWAHLSVGFVLPFALGLHVFTGHRSRKEH